LGYIFYNNIFYFIVMGKRLEKYSERFDNDKSAIGNPESWGM
jgi:hypothetical protein